MFNWFTKEETKKDLQGEVFKAFSKGMLTRVESQLILHLMEIGDSKLAQYYFDEAITDKIPEEAK